MPHYKKYQKIPSKPYIITEHTRHTRNNELTVLPKTLIISYPQDLYSITENTNNVESSRKLFLLI